MLRSSLVSPAQDLLFFPAESPLPLLCFLCCFVINFQTIFALVGEPKGLPAQKLNDLQAPVPSCPTSATAWQGWERGGNQGCAEYIPSRQILHFVSFRAALEMFQQILVKVSAAFHH